MMRSLAGFVGVFLFAVSLGGLVAACDDPAPDLTEWTMADHHNQSDQAQKAKQRRQPGVAPTYAAPSKRNPLVEVTWMKQCSNCHGKRGRGDGPESPMVKAKDLTAAEWQSSVTDEQILAVIKNGKGKMPSFNFPDSMLTAMVGHVRALPQRNRSPMARGGTGGAGGAGGTAAASGGAGGAAAAAPPAPAPAEDDESEGGEAAEH